MSDAAAAAESNRNGRAEHMREPEPEPEPPQLGLSPVPSKEAEGAEEAEEAHGVTLWVGNLPNELLEGDDGVKRTEAELRRVFFAHGVATAVSVRKKEGKNKSWAFVTFTLAESVQKALGCTTFVSFPEGGKTELTVKAADIKAQMQKRASTPDTDTPVVGAMESMWKEQNQQVVLGLRTPMQEVLEALQEIAATVPSVAAQIENITTTVRSNI